MIYPLTIAQPRDWARWAECEAATRRQVEPVCPYHSEARPESSEGKELRAAILEWIGDTVVTTKQVARVFSMRSRETYRHLSRLRASGLLVSVILSRHGSHSSDRYVCGWRRS